jgi:hypothetical protein
MSEVNRPAEQSSFLEEPHKMPDMINVLTILTFIGSGFGIIGSFWTFSRARASYEALSSINMDQLPGFAKRLAGANPLETARRALENRVPILLLGLIGCALCIYGAIQMRQLKKNGFTLYTIGELLPVISAIIFLGEGAAGFGSIIAYCIYTLFIVLYATQLKYLH